MHSNDRGELAVLGVLFREGSRNSGLAAIGAAALEEAENRERFDIPIADLGLIPKERAYYRYSGSLTTPPCSEGVLWLVLKDTVSVAREQVASFVKLIGEDARGPQPLNGRLVLE